MSVNISQAMNSPTYAHQLWLNYYYGDNSMDISASVIGRIEAKYGEDSGNNLIAQWEKSATVDKTEYEFSDEDLSNFKTQGEENAKTETGYGNSTGDKVGQWGRVAADGANAAGQAAEIAMTTGGEGSSILGIKTLGNSGGVEKAGNKAFEASLKNDSSGDLMDNITSAKADASGAESAKQTTNDILLSVACAMNLATGIAAVAKTANEEQFNALMQTAEIMGEQMNVTLDAQSEMEKMSQELTSASDEANEVNENANTQIDEEKSKYDLYKATYDRLTAKNEAAKTGGEPLTKEEQTLLANVSKYMSEAGANIEKAQDEASAKVNTIHSNMETYQEGFDKAAEDIAITEGVTDYASGFDTATKAACITEAALQGVNTVSGGVNAIKAAGKAAQGGLAIGWVIAWAAAAVAALSGAAMSAMAALKQMTMIKGDGSNAGINGELALREQTEEITAETKQTYDTELGNFAQDVASVENLELSVPDSTEAPESVDIVESQTDETNKKPEENIK